ncbi:MAG: hypothetical protein ACK6D1_00490 [Planctomycetota bacterium]
MAVAATSAKASGRKLRGWNAMPASIALAVAATNDGRAAGDGSPIARTDPAELFQPSCSADLFRAP